jgi:penicillin amidase
VATPSLAPRRRPGRLLFRVFLAAAVLVAGIAMGAGGWFYQAARSALPQVDGEIRLAGLSAPVSVIRDAQGVPHISAASVEDMLFAQGYVTAQDRLWEMDMSRRYGAGELSEILGPSYLAVDRRQRILGVRLTAQRAAAALPAEDRRLAEAYARGVNAFLDSHRDHLPVEFRVLRYSPRPWTVEDSLVVGATFSEMLNLGFAFDVIGRERVLARVPADLAMDLFPTTSWRDHPPMQTEPAFDTTPVPEDPGYRPPRSPRRAPRRNTHLAANSTRVILSEDVRVRDAAEYEPFERRGRDALVAQDGSPGETGRPLRWSPVGTTRIPDPADDASLVPGSNNWVISGAHTVTGKPLLSNDMHLEHHIPNVWYEIHISAPDFDVAGVSAPGIPFVIAGHNRRVAWGFTNLNPASIDLYIENFNPAGDYQTPDGWKHPERRREIIHVSGNPDVTLDVLTTRHGPIVTDLISGEMRKIALRWVLYDPAALSVAPFYQLDRAANWEEFRGALAKFATPGQNVVYADVDGHIGYQATGWVPLRRKGDGSLPVPGNIDDYEWAGYLPFDEMPRVFDPESGVIATANNRTAPDGYPHVVSAEWMPPYRAQRIYRVLSKDEKFSAADMLALQTDIYSSFDHFLATRFVYAVDHSSKATPRARDAANLMRRWDGRVTTDSVAPTIVNRARRQFQRLLLEPVLGADWKEYTWHMSSVWLENTVSKRPERWLPKQYASWDDLLAAALDRAVTSDAPRDLKQWTWGKAAPLYLQHPIFGRVPLLRRWSGPGEKPQSGDGNTVKQVGRGFGPSERMTVDFSDLDASTLNIVTGQSGNLFSPHYMDQFDAWYTGRTFRLPFSQEAVAKARVHELTLEPK